MKDVVVLGGGFGGVAAALALKRHLDSKQFTLTLIDKNSYHLFTPSLYEVATSEEPQKNIAIPFTELLDSSIQFIKGEVNKIDYQNNTLQFARGHLHKFDYLIVAVGSESADFHIPGINEYGLPLKTLEDAIHIKHTIKDKFHLAQEKGKSLKIIVGGGGFSGTELVDELIGYRDRLIKHHHAPKNCIELSVIQGSDKLLKELDKKVSDIAMKRAKVGQVKLLFGGHITQVTPNTIKVDDGNEYEYDVFIWTGGVRANSLLAKSNLPLNHRGQLPVDNYLKVHATGNIFAVGDSAEYIDPATKQSAPGVAQVAEEQGKVAGENVYRAITNQSFLPYHLRHFGYVVPMRGHFAVAAIFGRTITGFLGWIIQQLVFIRYLLGILPINKAFMRWNKFEEELKM